MGQREGSGVGGRARGEEGKGQEQVKVTRVDPQYAWPAASADFGMIGPQNPMLTIQAPIFPGVNVSGFRVKGLRL